MAFMFVNTDKSFFKHLATAVYLFQKSNLLYSVINLQRRKKFNNQLKVLIA